MAIAFRTQFPDLFLQTALPALDELIFNQYDQFAPQYTKVFRVMNSTRAIEQTSEIAGLGLASVIPEGEPMHYDSPVPGFKKTYEHVQTGLGFKMTRIMVDDDKWAIISKLATELGRSMRESVELDAATQLINGFATAGADGVPLFSASHPLVKSGGVQSNILTTAADLDIPSLELAITAFRRMKDPTGKKARILPRTLVIPPEYAFVAGEIMTATRRSDTANNTPNAFKVNSGFGTFDDFTVYEYLTDPDAWFIRADLAQCETRFYWREKFNTVHDVDFDTRSVKTAAWQRYSFGASNHYGWFGTPGA